MRWQVWGTFTIYFQLSYQRMVYYEVGAPCIDDRAGLTETNCCDDPPPLPHPLLPNTIQRAVAVTASLNLKKQIQTLVF